MLIYQLKDKVFHLVSLYKHDKLAVTFIVYKNRSLPGTAVFGFNLY
jgi:hypothetical protein